jgi:hypothetical protein
VTVNVKGTLEVWQEVAEIGPMLWRLAGLRSPLFESERYLLAEILRDVADALERGNCPQHRVDHAARPEWQAALTDQVKR